MKELAEYISDASLLSFYGWWQFSVCLFAFLGLMAIWYHIGRKQNDFGQVWLAISILCWSISGIVDVYFANQDLGIAASLVDANNEDIVSKLSTGKGMIRDGWRSILSLLNSLFILLALPWFRYIPKRIESLVTSKYWNIIVGLPFLFAILPTITSMLSQKSIAVISELDVYYATLTLVFLGWVLWESFAKRRLHFLAYLSVLCILITFAAQLLKLTDSEVNFTLFSAIFKTNLIMIFFALALSWVKELAENILPDSNLLFISFNREKDDRGKFIQWIGLKGLPGSEERKIELTPNVYSLFYKFSQAKIEGDGWLEIKPKNETRTQKPYDIKDYNEIKRILVGLLDGIFGKENWAKNQHLEPLKSTLFEMSHQRERKIRLRIPKGNIELNHKLVIIQ